jgi:hypothetical protein
MNRAHNTAARERERGVEAQISQAATLARPPLAAPPPAACGKILPSNCGNPQEIFARPTKNQRRRRRAPRALTIHITYLNPPVEQNVLHVFIYLNYAGAVARRHHCDKYSSSDSAEWNDKSCGAANSIRAAPRRAAGGACRLLCQRAAVCWLCSKSDTRGSQRCLTRPAPGALAYDPAPTGIRHTEVAQSACRMTTRTVFNFHCKSCFKFWSFESTWISLRRISHYIFWNIWAVTVVTSFLHLVNLIFPNALNFVFNKLR